MTVGEDGRLYILLRKKQEIRKDKKEATEHLGAQIKSRGEDSSLGEDRREEEVQIPDYYRDAEIEGLIREYKKNIKLTQRNMKILEFYGGKVWRTNEGAEMRRCLQRLVEEERNLEKENGSRKKSRKRK